jgi:hypothetical protein
MKRCSLFFLALPLVLLISTPVFAGPYSKAQLETLNFNLRVVMTGVDFYYSDTGTMPGSVGDLLQAGWIPANLRNPITDGSFDYYATDVSGGEIILIRNDNNHSVIRCLSPMDTVSGFQINGADIDGRMPFGPDLQMDAYQTWLQYSLFWYWNMYHEIPTSIEDMQNAGIWPFNGSEINPYTNGNLVIGGENPGDIFFATNGTEIKFTIYYSDDVIGCANLRFGDVQYMEHL